MVERRLILLGHGSSVQSRTSLSFPTQFDPPYRGSGLLQTLDQSAVPLPQVTEHVMLWLQSDQPPLTRKEGFQLFSHQEAVPWEGGVGNPNTHLN